MEKSSTSTKHVHGISDLRAAQFDARMAEIGKHLDAIDELLADAKVLEPAARRSATHLRGEDEVNALSGILEFAAAHAELFGGLADEDEGSDPTKFETDLLIDRLHNAQGLGALAQRFAALHVQATEGVAYTTQLVKPIVLKAYEIAKPLASRVSKGELLYVAKAYYGAGARTAARNRARKNAGPPVVTPSVPGTPAADKPSSS